MSNELALRQTSVIRTVEDVERVASAMAKSGYFQDSREMAQAVVKIMAGQEMGFGPFASMTGVYIIQGRPSISANLMASAVKSSGKYDYRVLKMTDEICELEFFQGGKSLGVSQFTATDAKRAGTKNLDKFPKNMLFARAMSNGVRWYCPDVFSGAPTYTPEELGADVNEDGSVINAQFVEAPALPAAPKNGNGHAPVMPPAEQHAPVDDLAARWPADAKISLETAHTITDRNGTAYTAIASDKLSYMLNAIDKKLRENGMTDDERAETMLKRETAATILKARATA